jgi:hypothetical protein
VRCATAHKTPAKRLQSYGDDRLDRTQEVGGSSPPCSIRGTPAAAGACCSWGLRSGRICGTKRRSTDARLLARPEVDATVLRGGDPRCAPDPSGALSPPASFIRAPGSTTLKTRALAGLVRHGRTTSPTCAVSASSGSPATRSTLPKRPFAEYVVSSGPKDAIRPSSMRRYGRHRPVHASRRAVAMTP